MKQIISDLSVFTSGNKKNTPIVFVHGFPFDHFMWNEQVKEFSKNYYCITYDIRGLGDSPAGDGQYTMESFVDDIESILSELNLNRPILCGLSMGGYISLRAVERMEKKFSALILCDTKSLADDNAGKINRVSGIKWININGVESFIEGFVANCFSENYISEHNSEYNNVLNRSKSSNPVGVKGCLLAMAARTDTTYYLEQISLPVLLVCGEKDKLTPPDVMKPINDKISNSEIIIVKDAGHMSPVEKSQIVNEGIKNFLQKV